MSNLSNGIEHVLLFAAAPADSYGGTKDGEKIFAPLDPAFFPSQIFWILVSFIVLYFLLSRVFLPRVGETIEERSSRIADDLDEATRMQREAEEAEKSFNASLADARAKATNIAETTKRSVDEEIGSELAAAEASAQKVTNAADARIRSLRTEALSNIESVGAEAAQAAILALIGKTVTLADVKSALN